MTIEELTFFQQAKNCTAGYSIFNVCMRYHKRISSKFLQAYRIIKIHFVKLMSWQSKIET